MKFAHLMMTAATAPWALEPVKLAAVRDLLLFKAQGGSYSAAEIAAKIDRKTENAVARQEGAVAVIPVHGVIINRFADLEESSGAIAIDRLRAWFRAALAAPEVKAVVLDVDSPGGIVYGVPEFAAEIFAARGSKPIVAHVNALAASAAYWLASSADEIVVTPSGEVGSIGVYTFHEDFSGWLEKNGIKVEFLFEGENKVEGNETQPLGDDTRAYLKAGVKRYYDAFVADVARGRGVDAKLARGPEFGGGRVFGAAEAVKRGMADRVATRDETLARFGVGPLAKPREAAPAARRAFAVERERRALADF